MATKKDTPATDPTTDKQEIKRGQISEQEWASLETLKTNVANIRSGALPEIPSLMESIEQMGLQTPLSVKRGATAGTYDIIDGFRRFQALIKLHEKYGKDPNFTAVDFANIPVAVSEGGNEAYLLLQQATANLQRVDTAPEDLGKLVQKLLAPPFNLDIPEVASKLGRKSDFIINVIKYTDGADDETKKLVRDGKMTFTSAVDSLQLAPEEQQKIKALAKSTKNKTEAKQKVAKAVAAATGTNENASVASKKGQKEIEDRLMVVKGMLGDEETFKMLKKDEVEQVKGSIAALEWSLGQRNTLPLPAKAEEHFMVKYKAKLEADKAQAESAKFAEKAQKAQEQAQAQVKKAQELAKAAELAAQGKTAEATAVAQAVAPPKKEKKAETPAPTAPAAA